MAGNPQKLPVAAYWLGCGVIPLFVTAFIGLGDVRAPMPPGTPPVTAVASENAPGIEPATPVPAPVMPAPEKTGNPLWAIPLGALSETVSRPLFSPSRRPPPAAVAVPDGPPAKPPPPPQEPNRPLLTLLGTIVGKSDAMGIFLDETSHGVIRLKTGQAQGGWILRSVRERAASFEKDHQQAIVAFAPPGAKQTAADVALDVPGTGRAGVCDNGQGPPVGDCLKSASPAAPAPAPTSASSRKKRWHDAVEAFAARNSR